MITDSVLTMFYDVIDVFMNLFPSQWLPDLIPVDWSFMTVLYLFISPAVFFIVMNTFIAYASALLIWSIVEWVYKKIPGVS